MGCSVTVVGRVFVLACHPDILSAARAVARYSHAPPKLVHRNAALYIARYIMFIKVAMGLISDGQGWWYRPGVVVHRFELPRQEHGREICRWGLKCVRVLGYRFSLGGRQGVMLSSAGAEYVAMADRFKDVVFLRSIWR